MFGARLRFWERGCWQWLAVVLSDISSPRARVEYWRNIILVLMGKYRHLIRGDVVILVHIAWERT